MKKLLCTANIEVRWRDLDELHHVNNSVYFTYFEQARIKCWQQYGLNPMQRDDGPILIHTECTFLRPVYYPAVLAVRVYLTEVGRSSFVLYYEALVDEQIHAQGSSKIVWISRKTQKSIPIPDDIKKLLDLG